MCVHVHTSECVINEVTDVHVASRHDNEVLLSLVELNEDGHELSVTAVPPSTEVSAVVQQGHELNQCTS